MNYLYHYKSIIRRAQCQNRIKGCNEYFEQHHIIPKCLGGSNKKVNLVLLTAREPFVCHLLLWRWSLKRYGSNHNITFKLHCPLIFWKEKTNREYEKYYKQ
jgi:hypothetical protein